MSGLGLFLCLLPGGGAHGDSMLGESKVPLSSLELIFFVLVMSMSPASSSKLIHQVLRSRDKRRSKYMGIILYYVIHYICALLSQ